MSAPDGLTVTVRFRMQDERAARELAAAVIERAHELANLPERECDVDVDVEWNAASAPAADHAASAPAADHSAPGPAPACPPDR